jgi:methyl-accepting chemotaxis protein
MNWFISLATRTKLMLGFGLIILFLIFNSMEAYITITAIQASQKRIYEKEFATAVDLKDIRANQNAIRSDLLAMMLLTDQAELMERERDIEERTNKIDKTMNRLLEQNRNDPEIFQKLQEFQTLRNAQRESRENRIIPALNAERIEDAKELLFKEQYEREKRLQDIADELVTLADSTALTAIEISEREVEETIRVFIITGIVIILLSIAIVVLLNRVIAMPLRTVTGIAERVASGDLTVSLPAENRSDEVGVLTQTFRSMMENLRNLTIELREGTNVLAVSASEIVATTAQVAAGAAETATAVSETTTTVEEVKKTAELSSDKARYVSETAQKAAEVSKTGRQAVEQSIEGVNQVRQQMEVLAESIVRLSEQGQAIGEVIATVNDLAEQSNLLAVNAAIEAAKAGEQGKGFGVVAQEIRSLAEQSKQATSQVRAILGDIQKATAASVLAAEQGSKAVEAGVKQAMAAGEAIKVLAQSIAEAAQAATQIAASSRQQQVGMDQVAQAMENIQQATSQNMAGTKQAETAAHNLSELGQKLKNIIEQFRV